MNKVYSKNRKSYHDFEMIESLEVGICLTGPEVKAVREGRINLLGSYVSIKGNTVILKQCHISRPDNINNYAIRDFDELRERRLLMHKKEIAKFHKKVKENKFTLIVTEVYQREGTGVIKCKLNLAKGKSYSDKRQSLKEKQAKIDTARHLKDY